ncbi:MAG TPA: M23 family metallopeptidase, partial [Rugosimonospora sp.]|nr:M23 family metallopeptidase [Rugosimonospora sp.]
ANAQRSAVLAQYRALQAESDRIAAQLRAQAARDRQSGHGSSATGMQPGAFFLTPVRGAYKSSGFGMRYDPYYHVWQLHAGVDLAAPGGTPIYAAGPGQVVRAGWAGGYGNYTCIYHGLYHGQGLDTCYGHQSRILVHVGQVVGRGQLIGLVGQTGAATGYHLHFEVRLDGVPVQPLNWLPACLC